MTLTLHTQASRPISEHLATARRSVWFPTSYESFLLNPNSLKTRVQSVTAPQPQFDGGSVYSATSWINEGWMLRFIYWCCTQYLLAVALVASRLLWLSMVCMEDANLCANALQLLAGQESIWEHNANWKQKMFCCKVEIQLCFWVLWNVLAVGGMYQFYFEGEYSRFPVFVALCEMWLFSKSLQTSRRLPWKLWATTANR